MTTRLLVHYSFLSVRMMYLLKFQTKTKNVVFPSSSSRQSPVSQGRQQSHQPQSRRSGSPASIVPSNMKRTTHNPSPHGALSQAMRKGAFSTTTLAHAKSAQGSVTVRATATHSEKPMMALGSSLDPRGTAKIGQLKGKSG